MAVRQLDMQETRVARQIDWLTERKHYKGQTRRKNCLTHSYIQSDYYKAILPCLPFVVFSLCRLTTSVPMLFGKTSSQTLLL